MMPREPTEIESQRSACNSRSDLFVIVFLMLVKAVLVLPAIGDWSLYRDDAWQSMAVRVSTWDEVILSGATAPGFAVLLHLWSKLSGVTTVALQMPAFLWGLTGPALCYCLARRICLSRTASGFAALLLCVSAVHTDQAARVKPYTFDVSTTMVMMYVAIAVLSTNASHKRKLWFVLLCLAFLSFTISSTAGIAGAALVGISGLLLVQKPEHRVIAVTGVGSFILAAAAWTVVALSVRKNVALREFWAPQLIDTGAGLLTIITETCHRVFQSLSVIAPFPGNEAATWLTILLPILGTVAGLQLVPFRYRTILLAPPLLAALLAATGHIPLGGGRTNLYLAPTYAILSGCLVERCLRSIPTSLTPFAIRFGAGALLVLALWRGRAVYPAEDIRQVTSKVLSQLGSDDRVIGYPETSYMLACYANMPLTLAADELAMTGFTPVVDDTRFLMLPGFETGQRGPVYQQAIQQTVESLRNVLAAEPLRIHVVRSRLFSVVLQEIHDVLTDRGYHPTETVDAKNAEAIIWERTPDQKLPPRT